MKKVGIIVAMGKELELLLPLLENKRQTSVQGTVFYSGTAGLNEVCAMQCGIGKVNAAIGTLLLIQHFSPDYIINTGVAGGGGNHVQVMDIVAGAQVAYHDVWCGPESEWGQVQGLPLFYEGAADLLQRLPQRPDVKTGLICSGDRFIDNKSDIESIRHHFPAVLAVDMESGAIAQVCRLRGVPFLSLRVISDSPGASHDNTRQYLDFWADAPRHSFEIVKSLISNL